MDDLYESPMPFRSHYFSGTLPRPPRGLGDLPHIVIPPKSDSTTMYVAAGAAALVIGYFLLKGRRR